MLTLVPTPIGNLADITLRALESLKSADVILCEDSRVAKKLLSLLMERGYFTFDAQTHSQHFIESKQFISFHSHNEDDFMESLSSDFFDKNVVYLSDAGMPCISDPGAKLVSYAIKHRIDFDVLPGACALNVAFCASGVESTPFVFVGFLPHKRLERQSKLLQLSHLHMGGAYSAICYESPHRILDTLKDIALLLPHTDIIVQKELTKLHQRRYYGKAEEILNRLEDSIIRGEWVIVIDFTHLNRKENKMLDSEEVFMLDIPPKVKAKILSKMSGKSIKQCYEDILSTE